MGGAQAARLWPGHSTRVGLTVDPRLLATWDSRTPGWSRAAGAYTFSAGHSSRELGKGVEIQLPAERLSPQWRP